MLQTLPSKSIIYGVVLMLLFIISSCEFQFTDNDTANRDNQTVIADYH